MATLDKILQFIANKLSTLENKTLKEEIITLGSTWTAKYDGTLVRIGRANAESAYMFCSDITNGQSGNFRGLATIQPIKHMPHLQSPC